MIPQELGGTRGFKRVLRRLGKYNYLGPVFYRQNLEHGLESKYYDYF